MKKTDDDTRACEEANEEQRFHVIDVSIQQALIEKVGCRFIVEEQQQLFEDAAECQTIFAGLRGMRQFRVAVEK
jgi:hypothetical protein